MSYPVGANVEVKFPLAGDSSANRADWPWLPGWIVEVCGPDEWQVCVQDYSLALTEDGRVPPPGTPGQELLFPVCYRDSSEIRTRNPDEVPADRPWTTKPGVLKTPRASEKEKLMSDTLTEHADISRPVSP